MSEDWSKVEADKQVARSPMTILERLRTLDALRERWLVIDESRKRFEEAHHTIDVVEDVKP